MMDSSTPCCKKTHDPLNERGMQRRALGTLLLGCCLPAMQVPLSVQAQTIAAESGGDLHSMQLQRDGEDLLLSVDLGWSLPEMVQNALLQGIPVHFIAEASMRRERWYWRDEVLLTAQRYLRLSYQPLTRRWRLYAGSQPFQGQGLALALTHTYEHLSDALSAMQRLVRWRIGKVTALPRGGDAVLELRFGVDTSQFPRPLQIGTLGRADWNLLVQRQSRIMLDSL